MKLNPIRERWTRPLVEAAADRYMVSVEEMLRPGRLRQVARARQYAIALARHRYGWSYPELGIVFGLDHSTCIHACKVMAPEMAKLAPTPLAKCDPVARVRVA